MNTAEKNGNAKNAKVAASANTTKTGPHAKSAKVEAFVYTAE